MSNGFDPPGFKRVHGLLWPEMDISRAKVIFHQLDSIDKVLKHVTNFSQCVQAGGNCGLWPLALAKRFNEVYTAEPHPLNFYALRENTKDVNNIFTMNCALGQEPGFVHMESEPHELRNCGAFYVKNGGDIPVKRIDDMELQSCGLIYLDVEGFEEPALRGAEHIIRTDRPVIVVEAKGIAKRYGLTDQSCADFIKSLGYQEAQKTNRDVIYTPA